MSVPKLKLSILILCMIVCAACAPVPRSGGPATLVPFPVDAQPSACPREEVIPTITDVQPEDITPGSVVTVTADGGYLRDTCGGYNESARQYKIYLDDEPIAEMTCYVHHCEGKFTMPPSAALGAHCLGVNKERARWNWK